MEALTLVHVSSLPPTECGIATYTAALTQYLHAGADAARASYVRLITSRDDRCGTQDIITWDPTDESQLLWVIEKISKIKRKVVLLQHEFGLFDHPDGESVVRFLDHVKAPVVTTLHTVWPTFPSSRARVFSKVIGKSTLLVVLSSRAATILMENYAVDPLRIRVVPHGIPEVSFRLPHQVEWPGIPRDGVKFVTTGLIRPTKGIEFAILAMDRLQAKQDKFTYVVSGMAHPNNVDSVKYHQHLKKEVDRLDLRERVFFVDRYLNGEELINLIQACDIGLLPYTDAEQSSSGVLALILGCGRPVIASDFQCAKATIQENVGMVVPIGDVQELSVAMHALGVDALRRRQMMNSSYSMTRRWCWKEVAAQYRSAAEDAETIY